MYPPIHTSRASIDRCGRRALPRYSERAFPQRAPGDLRQVPRWAWQHVQRNPKDWVEQGGDAVCAGLGVLIQPRGCETWRSHGVRGAHDEAVNST